MKTPAFQFYPSDFLSSPDVQMMTTQEVGAYCLLLFNAWIITDRPGYLPNNDEKLRRLCKLSTKEWKNIKDVILEKFPISECGKLRYNKRLIVEFEKQELRRQRLAENGKQGGRPIKPKDNLQDNFDKPKNNLQVISGKPDEKQEIRLSSASSSSYLLQQLSREKIFEVFRTNTDRNTITDDQLKAETEDFVNKYEGKTITSLPKLLQTWVERIEPRPDPKKIKIRVK